MRRCPAYAIARFGSRGSRFAHAQNSEWRESATRGGVSRYAQGGILPLHGLLHCTSTYLHIFNFLDI